MEGVKKGYRAVLVIAFLCMAIPVLAQLPSATILGTIKDSSGAVMPGVTVTVRNVGTNLTRRVKTGVDGTYRVPLLPVGTYEMTVQQTGFRPITQTGITLTVTQQAVINFMLQVGATQQKVVVTGQAPMVNTANATLGGITNQAQLQSLPLNGRHYITLTLLQPGVSQDKNNAYQGTTFSVNGAPTRSNNFTLDGAILQNVIGRSPTAGDSGDGLGLDGIEEFRVITSNFPAEYGMTMGSQIVMVSRGGTNHWHGDAFEYFRNSALDARNYFDQAKIPEFQRNDFGGSFGGPIKRNKTFFYAVYEGLRENLGVSKFLLVPAAGCHPAGASASNNYGAGSVITVAQCPDIAPLSKVTLSPYTAPFLALFPIPNVPAPPGGLAAAAFPDHTNNQENYGQIRVDQNFSASDTLFGRYTIDDVQVNRASSASNDTSNFRYLQPARNQYLTLSETHLFTPSVLNTARISFSRTNGHLIANIVGLTQNGGLGPAIVPGTPTGPFDVGGLAGSYTEVGLGQTDSWPGFFNMQNIYTISDDLTWTHGQHSFKFGVLANRFNDGFNANNSGEGFLTYDTFAGFLQSLPSLVEFKPKYVPFNGQLYPVSENRFYIFDTFGFYGQDDWRVTQRLTLNLGLRYEFLTTPHELSGRQSRVINDFTDNFTLGPIIKNNSLHDFSPRVGLAWDVFGNGKTALRAGSGIFYDIGNIGSALNSTTIGSPPYSGLIDIFGPPLVAMGPIPLPLTPAILNNAGGGGFTAGYMQYNWKSPYMIQYNVSVQQQLPWNMAVGVAYVGNHGVHIPTIREGNPIFPTSTMPCGDPASLCVNGRVPLWDSGSPNYVNINPYLGSDNEVATTSYSHYNGVQITLDKRTSNGLEFNFAYTRSSVKDATQGQEGSADCTVDGAMLGTYPLDPAVDYGPACFNVPNNLEISLTYSLPHLRTGNAFLRKAASGWRVSSIVSVQSGEPFSVILAGNRSQSGVLQGQADRANLNTAGVLAKYYPSSCPGGVAANCPYTPVLYNSNTVITGTVNQWYNPNMFSNSPMFNSPENAGGPDCANGGFCIGQLGTSGRNILPGPPERDWDFSLIKDTKAPFLGESGEIEFHADFFNILNHPNFAPPGAVNFSGDPTVAVVDPSTSNVGPFSEAPVGGAAQITSTESAPRQIQFALKFQF